MIEDHDIDEAEEVLEKLTDLYRAFGEGDYENILKKEHFKKILTEHVSIRNLLKECEEAEEALGYAEENLNQAINKVKAEIKTELKEAEELLEARKRDKKLDDLIRKERT